MDLGVRVMAGAGWAFLILNVAPDVFYPLIEHRRIPLIPGLAPNETEMVYVIGLALAGPLVLWLTAGRASRKKKYNWESEER